MRNLQLPFNQTQNVRLEKALEKLECLSSKSNLNSSVTVGDTIPVYEDGVLKGHGTSDRKGELVLRLSVVLSNASTSSSTYAIYAPGCSEEMEIGNKLHPRCYFDAFFNELSDGIQRRRTAADELNMCSIFTENDLVCAEVRSS